MEIKNPQEMLDIITQQESKLVFEQFTNATAFDIGMRIFELCQYRSTPVSIEIVVNGWQVFKYAMPGAPRPDNDGWLLRKSNTVNRFYRSSLAVACMMEVKGSTMEDRCLDPEEYVFAGGGFPITIKDVGVIGSVCVSALHHTQDHQVIVDAMARYLGVEVPSIV